MQWFYFITKYNLSEYDLISYISMINVLGLIWPMLYPTALYAISGLIPVAEHPATPM